MPSPSELRAAAEAAAKRAQQEQEQEAKRQQALAERKKAAAEKAAQREAAAKQQATSAAPAPAQDTQQIQPKQTSTYTHTESHTPSQTPKPTSGKKDESHTPSFAELRARAATIVVSQTHTPAEKPVVAAAQPMVKDERRKSLRRALESQTPKSEADISSDNITASSDNASNTDVSDTAIQQLLQAICAHYFENNAFLSTIPPEAVEVIIDICNQVKQGTYDLGTLYQSEQEKATYLADLNTYRDYLESDPAAYKYHLQVLLYLFSYNASLSTLFPQDTQVRQLTIDEQIQTSLKILCKKYFSDEAFLATVSESAASIIRDICQQVAAGTYDLKNIFNPLAEQKNCLERVEECMRYLQDSQSLDAAEKHQYCLNILLYLMEFDEALKAQFSQETDTAPQRYNRLSRKVTREDLAALDLTTSADTAPATTADDTAAAAVDTHEEEYQKLLAQAINVVIEYRQKEWEKYNRNSVFMSKYNTDSNMIHEKQAVVLFSINSRDPDVLCSEALALIQHSKMAELKVLSFAGAFFQLLLNPEAFEKEYGKAIKGYSEFKAHAATLVEYLCQKGCIPQDKSIRSENAAELCAKFDPANFGFKSTQQLQSRFQA